MALPSLIELAESGAHYGHHRSLTYPKARNFIYMVKNNVSLINLEETLNQLAAAQKVLHEYRADDRAILFLGTKRSIREIVKNAAETLNLPYITERWYGGFLTNFPNFLNQIKKMKELEEFLTTEKAARLEKKERARYEARLNHYKRFLGGVSQLNRLPELLVVGSATEDQIAIGEARKLGIPVIAITDTDINPNSLDYPIPANDDAPKAVELIMMSLVSPVESTKTTKKVAPVEPAEAAEPVAEDKPKKTTAKKAPAKKTATAKKTAATKTKKTTKK